jgi:hypothetical protein
MESTQSPAPLEKITAKDSKASKPLRRPAIFVDVDGVILPMAGWPNTPPLSNTWAWEVLWPGPYNSSHHFAPAMIEAINSLDGELHLVTSWSLNWQSREELLRRTGIKAPYFQLQPHRFEHPRASKLRLMINWRRSNNLRPFIWIDDDPDLMPKARRWARDIRSPSLLIQPDGAVGLTPEHIEQIQTFCRQINQPEITQLETPPYLKDQLSIPTLELPL